MTLQIPQDFRLIEQGKSWSSKQLINNTQAQGTEPFIEIDLSKLASTTAVVFLMISALLKAKALNIPVIFNRTGQSFNSAELPHDLQIGLFTSGTTGNPKLIFHTLEAILPKNSKKNKAENSRWLLCYNPMSFAGLQVILQAIVCADTLVSAVFDDIQQKAQVAIEQNITAISATPSFLKALLLAWHMEKPSLSVISCGGEICDQSTLNAIQVAFPKARIRHIYATTEAGVIFSVSDLLEGFPLTWINQKHHNWILSIENNEIILSQNSVHYATGDKVTINRDRVIFTGRNDNIINVGGIKVNLERIEQQLTRLPSISDVRVYAKKSPITGFIVCAEILSKDQAQSKLELKDQFKTLSPAEYPRIIQYCQQIKLSDMGKKRRIML